MILILAGSFQQASKYAQSRDLRPTDWRYVRGVDTIRGIDGFDLILTGSYQEREDFQAISELVSTRRQVRSIRDAI